MSKLYLITGFLGAGKTTFLRSFIRLFPGQKIQLIVNEFGAEGVDGTLLADMGAYLNEIAGGSVFCSCRMDQFEQVLRSSEELNADVILVEASGLSDPTGVRKLFSQTDRFEHIEYQGAICLVDAARFAKIYATARPCIKQLAASDVALINKADKASAEQMEATRAIIRGQRPDMPMMETSFGRVDENLLDMLATAGNADREDLPLIADLTLRKALIRIDPAITPYDLQKFIEMFLEATFRVKGFVRTCEGMYLVDCVGNVATLSRYTREVPEEKTGVLVALSGAGMPLKKEIKTAAAWYPGMILSIE